MSISFNSIPLNLRVPGEYVEIVNSQALQGLPTMPSRMLVFGQMLADGTATPNEPVLVPSGGATMGASSPAALFGAGSMLTLMAQAIKVANPWTELWAMPLADNPAGTAAAGSCTVGGPATQNATAQIYVNGTIVQFAIVAGMTAAQMATALQAAVAATQNLGVTAVVDGENPDKVDFTCIHKGADVGNTMNLRATLYPGDTIPAGVTFAFTQPAGGGGNPALVTALANLGANWFTDWVVPYTDGTSLAAVTAAIEALWGPTAMKDARVWNCTVGSIGTLASFGADLDEKLMTVMGVQNPPQPAWLWAAVYAAVGAYYLSIDPARQIATLPLTGIIAPAQADRFVPTDRNTLLYDGIATYTVDDGGNVLIERAITTYRTDASGDLDPSYLDIETLSGLAYWRYAVRTRIAQRFPRYKLAADGTQFDPGQAVATPSKIKNEIIALASEMISAGLMQDIAGFKAGIEVELDENDANTVDALMPPTLVNNFRIFKGQIAFIL